uniref:NADH-ubiquinone oxidoreductase chain 4L n=1 Tax=Adrisa magna TaxID=1289575 RepID=A0A4Y1JNE0_9HEMI|nr:NADH dehydrogenase subunit 4L [Adrisa magna]AMR75003.1 NADH dehydrogenase subunit 4L [Adrisa magna]
MLSVNFSLIVFMGCGVVVFCSTRKHILLSLLSLEFMVLSVYLLMFMVLLGFGYELYFSLIFLVFSVCEGALGLSILVSLVRSQGNDYLSSLSVLSW